MSIKNTKMKKTIALLLIIIGFIGRSQTIPFTQIQKAATSGSLVISGATGALTYTGSIPVSKVTGAISLTGLSAVSPLTYNNSTGSFSLTPLAITNTGSGNAAITGNTLNIPNTTYTLTQAGVYSALTYTPYNSTNPSNYIALTGISATSPLFYNNTTGTFSIQPASTSQAGALTSIDWNNFNAKLNSVNGTTNRITSSGGINPTIDISATFEALLSKIANRIDQNNSSTTSAQLATTITDETGTGVAVYGTAPTLSNTTISGTTTATGQIRQSKATSAASSATVDLSTLAGNYAHITGTTTIASFGTVAAGTEITLVFDGALTITSNTASIILPNNLSITTNTNDLSVWVSEGSGVFRLKSYQINNDAWLAWSPSYTGFSVNPAQFCRYKLIGTSCTIYMVTTSNGTSNQTFTTFTLPFVAANTAVQGAPIFSTIDNGGVAATGTIRTRANSNICDAFRAVNSTWTATAAKAFTVGSFTYEIQP